MTKYTVTPSEIDGFPRPMVSTPLGFIVGWMVNDATAERVAALLTAADEYKAATAALNEARSRGANARMDAGARLDDAEDALRLAADS